MNIPSIYTSYKKAKDILAELDILETENTSRAFSLNFSKFSAPFFNSFQGEDYDKIYKICLENSDYDLLLKDGSFFQFSVLTNTPTSSSINKGNARFAYYHNPKNHYTYAEFLEHIISRELEDINTNEVGDLFSLEYEQYISEAKLNSNVTPIRYDYDIKTYSPDRHACSHFHIGVNNDIRLATDKFIYPYTFVCFVIQHMYYQKWKYIDDITPFFKTNEPNSLVEPDLFSENEKKLIYIT